MEEIQRDTAKISAGTVPDEEHSRVQQFRKQRKARAEWFANAAKLPLPDFLLRAYDFQRHQSANDEGWHTDIFWFVWMVRGHNQMTAFLGDAVKAFRLVDKHICGWTKTCAKKGEEPTFGFNDDAWLDWFGVTAADATAEFIDVWNKSRFLPGHEPLVQAAASAQRLPLQLPADISARRPVASERTLNDYGFFVSLAGHLQLAIGDQPIRLPCENLATLMSVSKMTISRYRRWAIEDGLLKLTRPHKFRTGKPGDATEFSFDVSRWPYLKDKSHPSTAAAFSESANAEEAQSER